MATDLTQTLAQIIATNRQGQVQNYPMGQGPHLGRLPTLENVKPTWGGDIGQKFGQSAGEVVGDMAKKHVMWETDPQVLYKRAEMAQSHWNTMTPEEQEQMLQNPKFGETMAKFQKAAPELFTTTANGKIVPGPLPMQEALWKNQMWMNLGKDPKLLENYMFSGSIKDLAVGGYYAQKPDLERRELEDREMQHKRHMAVVMRGQDLDYGANMERIKASREHDRLSRDLHKTAGDAEKLAQLKSHLESARKAGQGFNSTLQKYKLDPQKGLYSGTNRMLNLGEIVVTGLGALDTALSSYENIPGAVERDEKTGAVSINAPEARAISSTLFTELDHQVGILLDSAQEKKGSFGGTWSLIGKTPLESVTKDAPTLARYALEIYRAYPTASSKARAEKILQSLNPYLPKEGQEGSTLRTDPMLQGMGGQ